MHRDTTFILLSFRGAPEFLGAYHVLFLSLFLAFLCGFKICRDNRDRNL